MVWEKVGSVKGPKGDTGATGAPGPQGNQGVKGDTGPAGSNASATTNAADLTTGRLGAARLPVVLGPVVTGGVAGTSFTPGDTGDVIRNVPLTSSTAAISMGLPSISSPADGQILRFRFSATNIAKVLTLNSGYLPGSGLPTNNQYDVPLGKTRLLVIEYVADRSAWAITASTVI